MIFLTCSYLVFDRRFEMQHRVSSNIPGFSCHRLDEPGWELVAMPSRFLLGYHT